LVDDTALLSGIAEIGIIFLLFLVGLDLPTQKLKNMLGESLLTAFGTTAVFFTAGAGVMFLFGYTVIEAVVVGHRHDVFEHHPWYKTLANYRATSSTYW
jgi:Kef-type K+ transport system membrane component KefB